ncbi:cytochrome c [Tateyamaria armeniaca]|uniref:Cytochrome c n=1 Tax=Tateyamaria armeniaca TaxID=2518930 RepID=A0ABW8UU77_9RHOB
MKNGLVMLLALALCATTALAHQGVKNPAVMARMHGMKQISDNVKMLGTMAKGQIAFDAATAQNAARAIARHSAESVALFTAPETDPKSEAREVIWTEFDDFSAKARDLETLANDLANTLNSLDDVKAAMKPLGASCKACHSVYRD